jgi:NAD(P)-dependent dehydrogenase (short-subunit alcohol dehydrogenase family)
VQAVIMGGTAGIGLAIATRLTKAGIVATVTGRDPERLAAARNHVAFAEQLDCTVKEKVQAFFERQGPFDHLILAFGPGATGMGPIKTLAAAQIREVLESKLLSYLTAIRYAEVRVSITMLSAGSARVARPGTVVLAAANGGIERAVPPLAVELAPVRVNAVSPGVIDTPWWAFLPEEQRHAQFTAVANAAPARRVGRPDDIAMAVEYLINADYVTGTVLPVDGGLTLPQ